MTTSAAPNQVDTDCDRCGERAPVRLVLIPSDGPTGARPTCYQCWMSFDDAVIDYPSEERREA